MSDNERGDRMKEVEEREGGRHDKRESNVDKS